MECIVCNKTFTTVGNHKKHNATARHIELSGPTELEKLRTQLALVQDELHALRTEHEMVWKLKCILQKNMDEIYNLFHVDVKSPDAICDALESVSE